MFRPNYNRSRKRGGVRQSPHSRVLRNVVERQLMRDAARRIKTGAKAMQFSNLKLKGSLDTYDPDTSKIKLSFLRKRSRVAEIVTADKLIFALTRHGVCAAFDRGMNPHTHCIRSHVTHTNTHTHTHTHTGGGVKVAPWWKQKKIEREKGAKTNWPTKPSPHFHTHRHNIHVILTCACAGLDKQTRWSGCAT